MALLRSGGNFSEAEEMATIKVAGTAESRVVNLSPTNRKRGGGLVSYKNQKGQKQAATFEVQSRAQASGRPEVSKAWLSISRKKQLRGNVCCLQFLFRSPVDHCAWVRP